MNTAKKLSFPILSTFARPVPPVPSSENQHFKVQHQSFGQIEAALLRSGHITAVEYKADLHHDLCIQYNEQQMLNTMNICFSFHGNVGIQLKQSNFTAGLSPYEHHSVYAPETEYDVNIKKNTHGFHLAIDLDYYTGLLCDKNLTTARTLEQIQNRRMVWSGTGKVNTAMTQALSDIFYNPLTGKFRSMLIEAKVLEVIALQLDQFSTEPVRGTMPSADRDTFHALKQFLAENFTEDLSLKGLSKTFGINEFKLKKGFRELFNTTIFDYIHDLKMKHAHKLLLDQKMFVSEVASEIGYKNPNHFSTAFKRKYGLNPKALK
jgi:AraC family transcriptional regulator, transcriptional activator of the genes for pyochelin and ferripyochelin receptors